jgi:hypothetical protein
MAVPRVVGWTSAREWLDVYDALFRPQSETDSLGSASSLCKAYSCIRLWQTRGKVPIAIDTTANFVNALLAETVYHYPLHTQSLLYSFAIVRSGCRSIKGGLTRYIGSSTGSATRSNQVRLRALSAALRKNFPFQVCSFALFGLASELIAALVDIRHEVTHNIMPSISTLRLSARKALEWLKQEYWDSQAASLRDAALEVDSLLSRILSSSVCLFNDDR